MDNPLGTLPYRDRIGVDPRILLYSRARIDNQNYHTSPGMPSAAQSSCDCSTPTRVHFLVHKCYSSHFRRGTGNRQHSLYSVYRDNISFKICTKCVLKGVKRILSLSKGSYQCNRRNFVYSLTSNEVHHRMPSSSQYDSLHSHTRTRRAHLSIHSPDLGHGEVYSDMCQL